jgi:hypothetical protein
LCDGLMWIPPPEARDWTELEPVVKGGCKARRCQIPYRPRWCRISPSDSRGATSNQPPCRGSCRTAAPGAPAQARLGLRATDTTTLGASASSSSLCSSVVSILAMVVSLLSRCPSVDAGLDGLHHGSSRAGGDREPVCHDWLVSVIPSPLVVLPVNVPCGEASGGT